MSLDICKINEIIQTIHTSFPETAIKWIPAASQDQKYRCNVECSEPTEQIVNQMKEHCKGCKELRLTINGTVLYYDDGLFQNQAAEVK